MPPRPLLPPDDLYARLELPVDASFEAVEVAWRALLKRHHPDVAGGSVDADDRAKRINVAHDWLSDPELRARYDRERHARGRLDRGSATGRRPAAPRQGAPRARTRAGAAARPMRRPARDAEEALARHLDRIERLTPDEIDRLTLAETPPIAFVASIARFLSPELLATLESVERRVHDRLPRAVRWNAGVRDSAVGFGQEIVLGAFLDEHLSGDFRERVRERLTRGWSAAVDQPRYGPNGAAVAAAIDRLRRLSPAELRSATRAGTTLAADLPARSAPPWPKGLRPDEDDALRVSSELARRDAIGAVSTVGPLPVAARRSLERAIHALVLRHAFPAAAFDDLVRPWRATLGIDAAPRPGIRSEPRPRH
jgi:curved DNA-binding protein CbpA